MEMASYKLGLYEKSMPNTLTWLEKLHATGSSGFDFLEISIDETDEKLSRLKWQPDQRQELVRAMWETGTGIRTMCLSGHRKYPLGSEDEAIRGRGMEIMADAISLAADLGVRIIQIAGYDEYYRPSNSSTCRHFRENLRRGTELAARSGVILAFETMETEFMNTVAKAMDFVRDINSPYLQVYPDLGNITNAAVLAGSDLMADIEAGRGHLAAMHLKETLPGKYREIPFGSGHVHFQEAIAKARSLGVGLFVGEFWYAGGAGWRQQLAAASQFLRGQFSPMDES
jgi:L-ribulose-5-phosphate 3-epimerase